MESESSNSLNQKEVSSNDPSSEELVADTEGSIVQSMPLEENTDITEDAPVAIAADIYSLSDKVLGKLCSEGKEHISNVTVSSNVICVDRVKLISQEHVDRTNFLLADQVKSEEQFNQIISKWNLPSSAKTPQKLKKLCFQLKIECENHLKAKDVTISKLREDINGKNEKFTMTRSQQEEEGELMSQRIKELIYNLQKTAENELSSIQYALEKIQIEVTKNVADRLEKELAGKEMRDKKHDGLHSEVWERKCDLRTAKLITHDELSSFRVLLKKDVHNFLLQLKATESIQFLNLDKLKYGLYVLQKQIKENKLISCDQKRFNVYAFDQLLVLKNRLKSIDSKGEKAYKQKLDEASKAQTKLLDLIKAAKIYHVSQISTFDAVSNEQEAKTMTLLHQALKVDAFVCKSFLGLDWEAPDLSFLQKPKHEIESKEQKLQKWVEFFTEEISHHETESDSANDSKMSEIGSVFYVKRPLNVEKLLEFIFNELDFLIEQKVLELSKTRFTSLKIFILTNSIFNAIGVKTCDDINYFMAHMLNRSRTAGDDEDKLVLGSRDILMGFQDFILLQKKKLASEEMIFDKKPISDVRKESSFWMPYACIIPPEKEKLWDAVIYALKKHHSALETLCYLSQKKFKLLQEKQELQRLLQKPTDN